MISDKERLRPSSVRARWKRAANDVNAHCQTKHYVGHVGSNSPQLLAVVRRAQFNQQPQQRHQTCALFSYLDALLSYCIFDAVLAAA